MSPMKNEEMLQHLLTLSAKGQAYTAQTEQSMSSQLGSAESRIVELETELKARKDVVAARDAKILLLEADVAELEKKLEQGDAELEARDDAEKETISQLTAPGDDA